MTTRVSAEAYQKLMQKCADGGCSTYEYLRQLVHDDVGVEVVPYVPQKPAEDPEVPKQTELSVKDERSNGGKIRIVG